ncbi:MAG: hypothetical protein ACI9W4_001532, partial [Rhodothermales bacterium]
MSPRFPLSAVLAALIIVTALPAAAQSGRIPVAADHGMVVTSQFTA